MKLTIAESAIHLSKQFGIDVEIVDSDGWIVNTKTSIYNPDSLGPDTMIDIMLSDGTYQDYHHAVDLVYLWDTTRQEHIVKYRIVG